MYRLIGSTHSLTGLPGATAEFLRALDSVRKTLADDAGLSGSELRAMAQIAESNGITPKQLADTLEITTGAITAITSALVARDLVTRTAHPSDRRSLLLTLTDAGHALMERNYRQFQQAISGAAARLDTATEDAVVTALTELTAALRARETQPTR